MDVLTAITVFRNEEGADSWHRGFATLRRNAPAWFLALPLGDVDHEKVRQMQQLYLEGASGKQTGLRLIQEVNHLMAWALRNGLLETPFAPMTYPPSRRKDAECLSPEARVKVLGKVDELFPDDLVVGIVFRALAWLGLSVGQAANFSFECIDFTRWEYVVKDQAGDVRCIPIPHPMRVLILKARQRVPAGGAHPRKRWLWISDQTIRNHVRQVGLEVGLPDLTPIHLARTALAHPLQSWEVNAPDREGIWITPR